MNALRLAWLAPLAVLPFQGAPSSAPASGPVEASLPLPMRLTHVTNAYACWSPDGRTLVFQSNAAGSYDLYAMDADGSRTRRIVGDDKDDITPAFAPDGKTLAFVSERDGQRDVYLCDADGSRPRNLTSSPGADIHPMWSRDGRRILFSSDRGHAADFDLYVMNADGSELRRLTSGPEVDTYASWSPDERRIVTRRVLAGENSEVFVLNADGGGATNLTSSPSYDGWPVWSADGRRIAYASGARAGASPTRIWTMRPDGSDKRMLTDAPPGSPLGHVYDTHPSFSPDGKRLAFTRYRFGRLESSDVAVLDAPAFG